MEDFIYFFENITTVKKLSWVLICLLFTWILEAWTPLVNHNYKKWRHVGINMIFFSFTAIINLLIGLLAVGIFVWLQNGQFGVLNWIELPFLAELFIAILALDLFAQYGIHYVLHKVKWLWKMHMVHHSDGDGCRLQAA